MTTLQVVRTSFLGPRHRLFPPPPGSILTDNPPSPGRVSHTTAVYVPYSFRTVVWVIYLSHEPDKKNCCETGTSFLSKKTRKSNGLQIVITKTAHSTQLLKTMSVGLPRVWTCDLLLSRPVLSQLSYSCNQVVVILMHDVRLQHKLIPSNNMSQYPDFNNSAFNGQCKESTELHYSWPRNKGAQINILGVLWLEICILQYLHLM